MYLLIKNGGFSIAMLVYQMVNKNTVSLTKSLWTNFGFGTYLLVDQIIYITLRSK